jgi:catechol 2,3-dioxygenase-like lactoylglutathione lyase family enzyme
LRIPHRVDNLYLMTSSAERPWHVDRMYHPSHRVPDLDQAEKFFGEVFGRSTVSLDTVQRLRGAPPVPGYPNDYSFFLLIGDVWHDCIDPSRYVIDGEQRYASVTEGSLSGFGWGVEGIEGIWREMRRHGIRGTDQRNVPADTDDVPVASFSPSPLFYTVADDTGLRYEVYPTTSIGPADPRSNPAWTLPPVSDTDPLGIEFCTHHTVVTQDVDRALRFVVEVLGGSVIDQATNTLLGSESTYVWLGDGVLEYAVPSGPDTPAGRAFTTNAPLDTYYNLTFKVRDLDQTVAALAAHGIEVQLRDDTTIIVEPANALGVPWGFTTVTVENDPRVA